MSDRPCGWCLGEGTIQFSFPVGNTYSKHYEPCQDYVTEDRLCRNCNGTGRQPRATQEQGGDK
jgi:hypothetical protein